MSIVRSPRQTIAMGCSCLDDHSTTCVTFREVKLQALSSLYVRRVASHDLDTCGCGRVRTIVAWVQDRSTSSECRDRFQAGAFSESTGGPVSGMVCCVVCGVPCSASVAIRPQCVHFDALLRNVLVEPGCWELFGVTGWEGRQHSRPVIVHSN